MVLIVFILKSFNLIIERFGSFENIKKINYQGFNFLRAIFTTSACPREKRPIIFCYAEEFGKPANGLTESKEIPLVAYTGSYVWIIWRHWREVFVPEEICGDFLRKKRCLNILKPWTDLSNLLFHLNLYQMWLIFHQTELSLGDFIFRKSTPKIILCFTAAMMKSVSKEKYLYWFYNLRD